MPRRRYYRRPDRRRHRSRRPPPTAGFLVRDLAKLAGVSVPTIKRYVRHGLLAPVPFLGTATRYPHDYLVRILALRYWRADWSKTLVALRRRQDSFTFDQMQAWVMSHPLSPETALALREESAVSSGRQAKQMVPASAQAASITSPADPFEDIDAALALPVESWRRWTLMPGLELLLKQDAAPITRTLAAQLCRAFAAMVSR